MDITFITIANYTTTIITSTNDWSGTRIVTVRYCATIMISYDSASEIAHSGY